VLFQEAAETGVAVALEHAIVGAALRAAEQLPPGAFVSVNASPALLLGACARTVRERAARSR
jgi:EAL domain-containing protein (putative c-di-GMP-specific phosphodiesterase class I)